MPGSSTSSSPTSAPEPVADPVAHWKQISGDGEGREILAALAEILDAGYVALPLGRDLENNRIYVWPYFAEVPLQQAHARPRRSNCCGWCRRRPPRRCVQTGKYTHWRLAIGADGTWHSFRKGAR